MQGLFTVAAASVAFSFCPRRYSVSNWDKNRGLFQGQQFYSVHEKPTKLQPTRSFQSKANKGWSSICHVTFTVFSID